MSRQKLPFGRRAFAPSRKAPIHDPALGISQTATPHGLETIRMAARQAVTRRFRNRIALLLTKTLHFFL
jgi:hypothetical protein